MTGPRSVAAVTAHQAVNPPALPVLAPEDCVVLDALGLSPPEAAVYLVLLTEQHATRLEMQARLGAHVDISASLLSLVDRGLIRRRSGQPIRYESLPPEIAIDGMVLERAAEFHRLREAADRVKAQLATLQRSTEPDRLVEVVRNQEELESRYVQLQRNAHREIRAFDLPPYPDYNRPVFNPLEVEEILPKGIAYRVVYSVRAVQWTSRLPDLLAGISAGEQARVLPDLPTKLLIFDDTAALIPLAVPLDASSLHQRIIVHPSGLLHALIALFEAYWSQAVPLRLDGPIASAALAAPQYSGLDVQILGLVGAGLTDEAIGRQLRISRSTVQRHVRELMDMLGARTRFQAGVQASKRGWL